MNRANTPASLEQRRVNVQQIAARRRTATHCKRGHEFTPENTIIRADGKRFCRTCRLDREWYYRHGLGWVR